MRRAVALLGVLAASAGLGRALAAEVPSALVDAAGTRMVRVIVQLRTEVGLEGALSGSAVATQRRAISRAQRDLIARLPTGPSHATRAFETVPYLALEVDREGLAALGRDAEVLRVDEDRLERAILEDSIRLIGADRTAAAGVDGRGWTVAVIDTGIDASHPFLASKVVSEACYSAGGNCPNRQTTQIGAGAGAACRFADKCSHGTHVATVAAGSDEADPGVAPGADLISLRVFSRFSGDECLGHEENPCIAAYVSDQVAALERVYALRHVFPIASVNISIGGGTPVSSQATCDSLDGPRKEVIENLRSVGIPTVVGAGNEGVANGLSAPACLSAAVSVGATNDADTVPRFSNSAPFLTFLAPGVDITSSGPRGEVATLSGTSMAAPHVAAAFAVLRQAAPAATLTTLLDAIADGGVAITDRRNGVTTPRVDLPGALDELGVSLGGPPVGVFEIPPSGGRISGILAFTGWICDAELVEIQVDGGPRVPAAYGTGRGDTIAPCGDADNGVSLLFNFALLGDGLHTASLLADGVEVGTSTFEVATLGAPFVHDLPDTIHRIEDFGGQDVLIQWSQQLQNFVIVGTE